MFIPARLKQSKQAAVFIFILIVVSLLQYSLSFRNDFVWDAKGVFLMDPSIKSLDQFPRYFTEPSTLPAPAMPQDSMPMLKYYRPITKLIHAIEHRTFGSSPLCYNTVNIFLNAAVVVLAFFLIQSITDNSILAFVASLLYAVNPARVEVVSWSYSDSYIFAALFTLLTLILYRQGRLMASYGCFVLSLLTHETAAVIPILVVSYEFFVQKTKNLDGYYRTAPYFALFGIFLALRRFVAGSLPLPDIDLLTLTNTIAVIIKRYVKIFIVPDAPITIYIYNKGMFSAFSPEVLVSYALLLGLAIIGVYLWFKRKDYLFWYLWFFLFCALSFNVGRFGEYLMNEKFLYTASLGFCVLMAIPAATFWRGRTFFIVILACLFVYHGQSTAFRQRYWKDTTTYLQEALKFAPDFTLGHLALAIEYRMQGDYDRALDENYAAIVLRPGLIPVMSDQMATLYYSRGEVFSAKREYDGALQEYQRALDWKANHSLSLNNIGSIYHMQGKEEQALASWRKAIQSDPSNVVPYYNIGMALQGRGQIDAALEYYEKYLSLEHNPPPSARSLIDELRKKKSSRRIAP